MGLLRRGEERKIVRDVAQRLSLRPPNVERQVAYFSGGNQQKVVLGKWRTTDASVLLLDEPTRGVDVGAKAEIYRLLRAQARAGASCLVFSSDAEEIAAACDRAYVLRQGRISAEIHSSNLNAAALTQAAL